MLAPLLGADSGGAHLNADTGAAMSTMAAPPPTAAAALSEDTAVKMVTTPDPDPPQPQDVGPEAQETAASPMPDAEANPLDITLIDGRPAQNAVQGLDSSESQSSVLQGQATQEVQPWQGPSSMEGIQPAPEPSAMEGMQPATLTADADASPAAEAVAAAATAVKSAPAPMPTGAAANTENECPTTETTAPAQSAGDTAAPAPALTPADKAEPAETAVAQAPSGLEPSPVPAKLPEASVDAAISDKDGKTGAATTKAEKPPYSYAALITAAITSQPDNKMTLAGIYDWITSRFPYFQAEAKGWKVR